MRNAMHAGPARSASLLLLLLLLPGLPGPAGATEEGHAMTDARIREAATLMNAFAARTGLSDGRTPRRYLWTDAFAVCNYLGLARATGEEGYTRLALQLVEQVHHTLGRHRPDDHRRGWISGLAGPEGERHPTRGGLRIGKPLPERAIDEPPDDRLEWERDGQYFHYLTRWMHALDQVARSTRQARYNDWARELARTAIAAFIVHPTGQHGPGRMVWKTSIDLTRVLVPSMGQHDPLDGYITALQLQVSANRLAGQDGDAGLAAVTSGFAALLEPGDWTTADPLGLGSLLVDAWRVQQLLREGTRPEVPLLGRLLEAAAAGLHYYARSGELQQPASQRLAFRELGLAIGLHALERLQQELGQGPLQGGETLPLRALLQELAQYLPLRAAIENFWLDPDNRRGDTWNEHRDINEVMLATSLVPDGYLRLSP